MTRVEKVAIIGLDCGDPTLVFERWLGDLPNLRRLVESGLVTVTRIGNQKHYQANPAAPIYTELCGIAMKTVGLAEPLRQALAPLARQIVAACVFGSVARRGDTAASDIDVLVLTDKLDYADVFATLQAVEMQLARPVNPTLYSRADWRRKRESVGLTSTISAAARKGKRCFQTGGKAERDGQTP